MKKLRVLPILLLLMMSMQLQETANYYVSVSSLNFRKEAKVDAVLIQKLSRYDNVIAYPPLQNGWMKISFNGTVGYVSGKYIKEGTAVVSTSQYRVGAICRDGSRSAATGRGACSHHGGVSRWLYNEQKSVIIKK